MKQITPFILLAATFALFACNTNNSKIPVVGTWQLVSSTTTEGDTTYSTFNPGLKMIKIINPTHFAFMSHDVGKVKDTLKRAFAAGGGKYTLADSSYTEYLEYYIDREWENNTFQFVVKIVNDTLIQKGIEKVDKLGVNRVIVEKYKRITN